MSTRARTFAAAWAIVLLGAAGIASADEIEVEEVIVAEEVVTPTEAEPEPEEPCCTSWPLGYVDRTFDDITAWWAVPGRDITIGSGLSTSFQWDFNKPGSTTKGVFIPQKTPFRFNTNNSAYYVDLFQFSFGYRA